MFCNAMDTLSDEKIKRMLNHPDMPLYELCYNSYNLYDADLTDKEIEWKEYILGEDICFKDFLP